MAARPGPYAIASNFTQRSVALRSGVQVGLGGMPQLITYLQSNLTEYPRVDNELWHEFISFAVWPPTTPQPKPQGGVRLQAKGGVVVD